MQVPLMGSQTPARFPQGSEAGIWRREPQHFQPKVAKTLQRADGRVTREDMGVPLEALWQSKEKGEGEEGYATLRSSGGTHMESSRMNATRNCALVSLFLREVFFSPPNIFPCFPGGWVLGKISPTLGISMFYPTSGTTV